VDSEFKMTVGGEDNDGIRLPLSKLSDKSLAFMHECVCSNGVGCQEKRQTRPSV
jgi:hypothetical protein